MKRIRERQCRCCKESFQPDYRNTKTQAYCSKPACRKASKTASQRRWSRNNPGYFKGSDHVERVREWRKANPERSRRKSPGEVLQDDCSRITPTEQEVIGSLPLVPQMPASVLQDYCLTQHPVFIGLIAHFTGTLLQEDIAAMTRRLEQLGQDVIGSNPTAGGHYDPQVPNLPRPNPQHPRAVQLGGPTVWSVIATSSVLATTQRRCTYFWSPSPTARG